MYRTEVNERITVGLHVIACSISHYRLVFIYFNFKQVVTCILSVLYF